MNYLNPSSQLLSVFLDIRNDSKFSEFKQRLTPNVENSRSILIVDDNNIKRNTCVVSFSPGSNHYKVEHWGGIENTAFNLGKQQELVLTTIILNMPDFIEGIKNAILKAMSYESIYYQWIQNGNVPKITAKYYKSYPLNTIFDNEVQYKELNHRIYLVTNKRQKSFQFSADEFFKNFNPISTN